jgi:hypothetical protein
VPPNSFPLEKIFHKYTTVNVILDYIHSRQINALGQKSYQLCSSSQDLLFQAAFSTCWCL